MLRSISWAITVALGDTGRVGQSHGGGLIILKQGCNCVRLTPVLFLRSSLGAVQRGLSNGSIAMIPGRLSTSATADLKLQFTVQLLIPPKIRPILKS